MDLWVISRNGLIRKVESFDVNHTYIYVNDKIFDTYQTLNVLKIYDDLLSLLMNGYEEDRKYFGKVTINDKIIYEFPEFG